MYKAIYFLGIGGIGMSALARYCKKKGYATGGYDRTPSPLTAELEAEGIEVHYEDRPDLVPDDEEGTLVVYTPAVPETLEELRKVRSRGYRLVKRAQLLGELCAGHKTLAVAGTHGKTTTSTLVGHIIANAGIGCTAFLGGISKNYSSNLIATGEKVMVAEADEYDRSFHQLHPAIAAITSMDADHLDIYGDLEHVHEAFRVFASQVSDTLIVKYGLPISQEVTSAKLLSYACDDTRAHFHAENLKLDALGHFVFDIVYPGGVLRNVRSGVLGRFNVENCVAAAAICLSYGMDGDAIRNGIGTFQGARRRLDVQINTPSLTYIDDYAHHPQELGSSIRALREIFPGRKISGIFQPHLYTRTRDFAEGFAEALSMLDEVILLDIYPAREEPIPGVSSELIYSRLTCAEKVLLHKDELLAHLESSSVDVLVSFGAGDIDRFVTPITKMLEKRL